MTHPIDRRTFLALLAMAGSAAAAPRLPKLDGNRVVVLGVKYRTEVLKLTHDGDGVTVTVRNGAGQHEIRADHCVCALPFPLLRQVDIQPAFSRQKMDAIAQYGLFGLARVSMQTRTRFWRNDPLGPLGPLGERCAQEIMSS